jgi:hypothetical protein
MRKKHYRVGRHLSTSDLGLFCRFNLTMDPKTDIAKTSTCTSCRFKEDKSNYWTAVLYFKHTNGSYIRVSIEPPFLPYSLQSSLVSFHRVIEQLAGQVPQIANGGTGNSNGGMTVYYIQPPKDVPVVSFAKVRLLYLDCFRRLVSIYHIDVD